MPIMLGYIRFCIEIIIINLIKLPFESYVKLKLERHQEHTDTVTTKGGVYRHHKSFS